MNKVELVKSIADKQQRAQEYVAKLGQALVIQNIWPDAFNGNGGVSFSVDVVDGKFTHTEFMRSDGVSYTLSRKELLQFKSDAKIHRNYK